jgi:hypothetical protein
MKPKIVMENSRYPRRIKANVKIKSQNHGGTHRFVNKEVIRHKIALLKQLPELAMCRIWRVHDVLCRQGPYVGA